MQRPPEHDRPDGPILPERVRDTRMRAGEASTHPNGQNVMKHVAAAWCSSEIPMGRRSGARAGSHGCDSNRNGDEKQRMAWNTHQGDGRYTGELSLQVPRIPMGA